MMIGGGNNLESRAERIDWIDTSKGIGIILVMLGHCYLDGRFTFWFYSFHMELFFFLSGYTFSGKETYLPFLKKKVRTLLVPYIFFVLVTMLCNGALAVTHGSSYDVGGILKLYMIQNRYTLLWFITCLFLSEQLMYLLDKVQKKIVNRNVWSVFGIIGIILFAVYRSVIGIDLPWNADLALLATAFMCFGKWYSEIDISCGFLRTVRRFLGVLAGITYITCSWINFRYFGKVDIFSDAFGNPCLFIIAAILGTLFIIEMSKKMKASALTVLGRNSLLFYGLHRIVIDISYTIYYKLGITIIVGKWSSFVYACISVLFAIMILTPINWFIIKYCPWCLGKAKRI